MSSFIIVTGVNGYELVARGSIPDIGRDSYFHQHVQTDSAVHPVSCAMDTGVSPEGKGVGA